MSKQTKIDNFFKEPRKKNSVESAFDRQFNQITNEQEKQPIQKNVDFSYEIKKLKCSEEKLIQENRMLQDKYTKLKTKYIQLLSILMDKESEIRQLKLKANERAQEEHLDENASMFEQVKIKSHTYSGLKKILKLFVRNG